MREKLNSFRLTVPAISRNEAYCRSTAIAFLAQADPTVEEIADIKTVMSEAVTNCIVHAYKKEENNSKKLIHIYGTYYSDNTFKFIVKDKGCGIDDIEKAMEPLYTTDPENERSGMGLPIMQTFSDSFKIISKSGKGTTVTFTKKVNTQDGK
ncbi:MAG: anti-sigma F factor [Clostridia bacterium]|nr:anti-sigma F factor [Clostridia bacterium]